MNQRVVSLMDVLAPPGNDWLKEISRRRSDLPAGVHVVRFSDADDELAMETEAESSKSRPRKAA
jgi:hypothetical protein